MTYTTDCLIIGGGIIGLLTAYELSKKKISITLIDKQHLGQEASWAGGGIISPLYPWRYAAPITNLATWAQKYYPTLTEKLEEHTQIDPELLNSGMLMLNSAEHNQALTWAKQHSATLTQLNHQQLTNIEPKLKHTPQFTKALWMPTINQVRNPRLLKALIHYLNQQPNITLKPHTPLTNILKSNNKCIGIQTPTETIHAQSTILCTGAWTNKILNKHHPIHITPIKGQMLMYKPEKALLRTMILHNGKYLIPRKSGEIIAGSTLENEGFNKTPTHQAHQTLKQAAENLLPELSTTPIHAQWTGLRPQSPNSIPTISEIPTIQNLYLNAGHFRNGLVLAPAAAKLMTSLVLKTTPILNPAPYKITTQPPHQKFEVAICDLKTTN